MKKLFILTFLFAYQFSIAQNAISIEDALFNLPDVKFTKISDADDEHPRFECFIKQPVSHSDASKGHFYQRVEVTHRGFGSPTVMNTNGYNLNRGRNELVAMMDANYINIEHRYFGKSIPEPLDWKHLNLENVAGDLHRINTIFKNIYKGEWVSTGISKGGQTTIAYRYFYPDDVDVSVPYVAPLNLNYADKRIYTFLDTVGTDECRKKIYKVQKKLLKNRKEVLGKLKWFAKGQNLKFDYLGGIDAAFEYAVLEYPFSFWQWGFDCDDLPTGKNLEDYIQSFVDIVGLQFYDDKSMKAFASHYYQATTQMGYYCFETDDFKGLIKALEGDEPSASFMPEGTNDHPRDYSLMTKIDNWLKDNGNEFIYIYGGIDTWSATRVIPTDKVDAKMYLMAGKHHGNARIRNLSDKDMADLEQRLEGWLNGVDVKMKLLKEWN